MADDLVLKDGSGTNFTAATKEVSSRHFQRMMMTWGGAGVANDASDANPLPVKTAQGYTSASGTITRPSNTTAYAAGDVVGATAAAISFADIGPSGKDINITRTELRIDLAAVPSGMTSFRLELYSVTPPSALADNDPFDLVSGDRASYLGFIDMGTPVDKGSTLYAQVNGVNTHLKLAGTGLFAYLVTVGGYTPTSAATFAVTLHAAP